VGFDSRIFFPWMAGQPRLTLRARPLSLRGDPANIGKADRQRFGPSCVLLNREPQGRTESGGIVLAANAWPRVPRGGVTLKRRCTHRPSVIYLIVNKLFSLPPSLLLLSSITTTTTSPPYLPLLLPLILVVGVPLLSLPSPSLDLAGPCVLAVQHLST